MWYAAIIMGLAGSLHCVGMCGPIALALPGARSPLRFLAGRLAYNLGRSLGYAALGLLAGSLGAAGGLIVHQQGLSIASGVFILALGAFPVLQHRLQNQATGPTARVASSLRQALARRLKLNTLPAMLMTGLLNSWLPCGLVFAALAAALAAGNALDGALFMGLFGLATIPAMLSLVYAGRLFQQFSRFNWLTKRNWQPALSVVVGVLFILRGFNLGIPMVSPKVVPAQAVVSVDKGPLPPPEAPVKDQTLSCCHKPQ